MALPTYVGGTSAHQAPNSSTSTTVTLPAGLAAGDMMLMVTSVYGDYVWTAPSGWTELHQMRGTGGSFPVRSMVAYKVADAADVGGSVTVTHSGSSDRRAISVVAYRNAGTTPNVSAAAATGAATHAGPTTFAAPSVTTTVADCLVVSLFGVEDSNSALSVTPDSPLTLRTQSPAAATSATGVGDEEFVTAGATTARTATASGSTVSFGAFTVALAGEEATPTPVSGAVAASLPAVAVSLSGAALTPPITATLASTLPLVTFTAVGGSSSGVIAGTLTATLPTLTTSLSGLVAAPGEISGVLAAQLPAIDALFRGGSAIPTTDTFNRTNGRTRSGTGWANLDEPVATVPATVTREPIRVMAQTLPTPTLEKGRPV